MKRQVLPGRALDHPKLDALSLELGHPLVDDRQREIDDNALDEQGIFGCVECVEVLDDDGAVVGILGIETLRFLRRLEAPAPHFHLIEPL